MHMEEVKPMADERTTETETRTDENGFSISDYPEEIDNGLYVLLGLNEWGGWYYNDVHHRIANYKREDGPGETPLHETTGAGTDLDPRESVGEFILGGGCGGSLDVLSSRGEEFVAAAREEVSE